jgi:hypothetical protein
MESIRDRGRDDSVPVIPKASGVIEAIYPNGYV